MAGHSTGQGARRAPRPPALCPQGSQAGYLLTAVGRRVDLTHQGFSPLPTLAAPGSREGPGQAARFIQAGREGLLQTRSSFWVSSRGVLLTPCHTVIHTLGLYPQPPGLRKGAEGIRSWSLGPKCPPTTNPGEDHPDSRLPEASGLPAPLPVPADLSPTHPPSLLGITPALLCAPQTNLSSVPSSTSHRAAGNSWCVARTRAPRPRRLHVQPRLVYLLQPSAFQGRDTIFLSAQRCHGVC